jgi:cytochrome c-type biogenesis protein CcmF
MLPEIAQIALILALIIAVFQGIYCFQGNNNQFAHNATKVVFYLVLIAYLILTYSFITHDFSIKYVATNSNLIQPLLYRISGVWGAHEGSLLLWVLIQSAWTFLVSRYSTSIPNEFTSRVLAILSWVNVGFISFMLFTSNPFDRILPAPLDGRELNPLLQDPGLAIHPPLLYIGYVGFSVAFAFAVSALLSGKLDAQWAKWARPWTNASWLFLTIGITLGSWWAYYELGWGGWWFWDPVENASFMPWLVGTALIHSLAVTEKRGAFIAWTVLLAIFTFSLSLLGTFLVRSGVLTSVHSFASDPERGLYILIFLGIVIGGSLLLYSFRAHKIKSSVGFALFSKESSLLMNNVFLVISCLMVLLGTLFPLVLESLGYGKISVGAPYFDFMFIILTIPLALLVGVGAMSRWKRDSISRFYSSASIMSIISAIAAISITFLMSQRTGTRFSIGATAGVFLSIWVTAWTVHGWLERCKNQKGLAKLKQPASFVGMSVAHLGIAVFILGVTHVNTYSIEKNLSLTVGETFQ